MLAPIITQNRAAPLSIFERPPIGPRVDFELAGAFRPAIAENLLRPPAFEISAAPDADFLNARKFERAIHPTATAPFGRAHIPVGMVVEGNKNGWLRQLPNPKRSEMVKIAGAVKEERRQLRLILAIKFFDQTLRRGKAQLRPPITRVPHGQAENALRPRVIQIEMKGAAQ